MCSALKGDKDLQILEYLGCTIDAYKIHIEGSFQAGMSWENYGAIRTDGPRVWNIDHSTPIKYPGVDGGPPTLEDVAVRLHWTNTKAMWADENFTKGNRRDDAPRDLNIPVGGAAMIQGHTASAVHEPTPEPDQTQHPYIHGC